MEIGAILAADETLSYLLLVGQIKKIKHVK